MAIKYTLWICNCFSTAATVTRTRLWVTSYMRCGWNCNQRVVHSGVPRNFFREGLRQEFFFGGGVQQIQLRADGRGNGDLGALAPSQEFYSICKWVNPVFWLGSYGRIYHGTGNLVQLCQNFGISGGEGLVWTPKPPPSVRLCYCICSSVQSFRHDIQTPRQMQNAARDIYA
jgi:hypothetical protein